MKRFSYLLFTCLIAISFTTMGCNKKTGCKINDNAHVKLGKNGELPTKRGKSNLFGKKTR